MSTGGSITCQNHGGYVARFYVKYTKPDGQREAKDSGDFSIGVNKVIEIPAGSTEIVVKAEENWAFGWSNIFLKEYPGVVCKIFELLGTTLDPHYKERDCN